MPSLWSLEQDSVPTSNRLFRDGEPLLSRSLTEGRHVARVHIQFPPLPRPLDPIIRLKSQVGADCRPQLAAGCCRIPVRPEPATARRIDSLNLPAAGRKAQGSAQLRKLNWRTLADQAVVIGPPSTPSRSQCRTCSGLTRISNLPFARPQPARSTPRNVRI